MMPPVTDFIVRKAIAGSIDTAFDGWNSSSIDAASLTGAESAVQQQLQPLLNAAGVSGDVDMLRNSFTTDSTGMDAVLDSLDFAYSGNTATVTNTLTGSSFSDDVSTDADDSGTGLQSSDEATSRNALTDGRAINGVFQIIVGLFAERRPMAEELNSQWAPYVADDYLEGGTTKKEELDSWLVGGYGPDVGLNLNTVIIRPLESSELSGSGYAKGYQIRLLYSMDCESGSMKTKMVFNGSKWLWWGDRRWIRTDIDSQAHMRVRSSGQEEYVTGIEIGGEDSDSKYAYYQGVRSAIVTGPGLPSGGVVLEHTFPDDCFHIYPNSSCDLNHTYCIGDDSVLASIPDNAEYTTYLFSQTAATLSSVSNPLRTYNSLQTYTDHLRTQPYLNSELNSSIFPTLVTPDFQSFSEVNIPGIQEVSWTNPPNTGVHRVELNWGANGSYYQLDSRVDECAAGTASVTFDSRDLDLPAPDSWLTIWMSGGDIYGRDMSSEWIY